MSPSRIKNRTILLLVGLLVVLTPVVILVITLFFLTFAAGLQQGEITTVELVELYAIEFVVLAAFAYLVYRLTLFVVEEHLPEALDAVEPESDSGEGRQTTGRDAEPDEE